MGQYKLNYFDLRGLGETARILMTYGGIQFEDRRWSFPEWPAIKPTSPTGKAPWLEFDGHTLSESCAINRYLAKKIGLIGKNDFEAALVDAAVDKFRDFFRDAWPYFEVALGRGPGDKEKLRVEVLQPAADQFFPFLQKQLEQSGSGFLVSGGLTWGDFYVADFLFSCRSLIPDFEKEHANFVQYSERILATPQIKEYIVNRKHADI